ncbi:MAG TPA: hypothetical protein VM096_09735 [Vicinamibacterales bacterium]|nr:hypothetical protein [Vicinamibacterales bacterium]
MDDHAVTRMMMRAQEWVSDHVAAMVWILLLLWTPPIAFTVLVDLKLTAAAGSGYLSLRDPGLLLSIMQIMLMFAALPLMRRHAARARPLLLAALGVWFAHAAWTLQVRLRLIGRADLLSPETLVTFAALAAASGVMFAARDRRRRADASTALATTIPQPAVQPPGTT